MARKRASRRVVSFSERPDSAARGFFGARILRREGIWSARHDGLISAYSTSRERERVGVGHCAIKPAQPHSACLCVRLVFLDAD